MCQGCGVNTFNAEVPGGATSMVCWKCNGSGRVAKYKACALCDTILELEYLQDGTGALVNFWVQNKHGEERPLCDGCHKAGGF